MSGGVDSSVSALLLKKEGFEVIGVHFVMIKAKKTLARYVEKIAKKIEIPLIVEDVSKKFKKEVVDCFVSEYENNRTPNPCVVCNPGVKFSELARVADENNIEYIATGHYACIDSSCEKPVLKKAAFLPKDQSYFLYRLPARILKRTMFPLGKYDKAKIKAIAVKKKLPIQKEESQDACFFLDDKSLREFLKQRISKKNGHIVDEGGAVLGEHAGSAFFTIGQRRGLNINGGPFYVIGKEHKQNEVVVTKNTKHPGLNPKTIIFNKAKWIFEEPARNKQYLIKTRYQGKETKGTIERAGKEKWRVNLKESQRAVAPGQSLVVYDKLRIIGGGIIIDTL